MTTLTEEKNLVKRLNRVAPQPAHYLVVFKKMEEGKRLRACVSPGDPFKKPIFESLESFVAFAVPADLNLRHRFQRTYKSHDLLHSFVLNFTLDYWVSDPTTLVERLDSDPLKRLEEEVDLILDQRKKSLGWSAIEQEQTDLGDVLFNSPESRPTLDQLSGFASTQGLSVRRVAITRDLPSDEISVATHHIGATRQQKILEIDHETKQLEQSIDQDLKGKEAGFGRRNAVANGITDNLNRAISQATDPIRTFKDIQKAAVEGMQIQATVAGMAAGGAMPAVPLEIQGGAIAGELPASADPSSCGALLSSISTAVDAVATTPADRRQLLSSCLHVVAEALRGEEAHEETLAQYTGALSALLTKLLPILKPEQTKFLRSLQDTNRLRRELS
jgi:hypothetical protein